MWVGSQVFKLDGDAKSGRARRAYFWLHVHYREAHTLSKN